MCIGRYAARVALSVCCLAAITLSAHAGSVLERVRKSATLRVCIWPEYFGISHRNPNTLMLEGLDIDLSQEFAKDLRAQVQYVDSSFSTVVDDVNADRCDVAMFAVGILPKRMDSMRFSKPYMKSDIYAVSTKSSRIVRQWSDIDRPGVLVGVQSGTFMEPVMRASLQFADLVVVKPPQTRERELEAGRIDVFMTDFPYSRRLLSSTDWARLISPPSSFHVLPYGYAVKPGDSVWLAKVDGFVARIKRDGRLLAAAGRHGLLSIVIKD